MELGAALLPLRNGALLLALILLVSISPMCYLGDEADMK